MKNVAGDLRLPSREEPIAPVTILDGQGRVVRVVPAEEFRRPEARPLERWRDRRRIKPRAKTDAIRRVAAIVVAGPLLMSASAWAEQTPPDRPAAVSAPAEGTASAAQRGLDESIAKQRQRDLLREVMPSPSPDLGYDLVTGIQQRMIENARPR